MTERLWYAALDGKQAGPFNDAQLRDLIARGQVTAETLIWSTPMTAWTKAGDIPGLMPGARPPAMHGGEGMPGGALSFDGGTWALLGRSLLVAICQILVIPSPWANTSYYRWFVEHTRLPIAKQAVFTGQPLDIWYIFILNALCGWAGTTHNPLALLAIPLNVLFTLLILRWFFTNLSWEGREEPLRFTGGYWPLLGWFALLWVSIITIIGWAWVTTAMNRWICRHIEGSSQELSFVASGWGMLWRTILFGVACALIIPIPWVLRWYVAWMISQFHLGDRVVAAPTA
jgi:hypothetical protein